jgi:sugar lactone lactonase YvrE
MYTFVKPICLVIRRNNLAAALLILVCTFSSCTDSRLLHELEAILKGPENKTPIPNKIDFTKEALYPEGVSHDARGERFLVTSLRFGTIGSVTYNGSYTPFIEDNDLISTIGIKADEPRNRVLVAVSDPGAGLRTSPATAGKLAALGIYNLTSGTRIKWVNLGALRPGMAHFANDLAIDPEGNVYVTDSFSPIIYKVDVNGNASVFLENERFVTQPGEFGFNGIVYHPSGYLIVAFSKERKLFKFPVANPSGYSEVNLNTPLMGPDGLLLSNNGKQLIVVNNAGGVMPGKVMSFNSGDTWATATLTSTYETGAVFPTTATAYKKEVFVLYAYLNRLFSNIQPPVSEFTIQKVPFANMNF